MSFDLGGPTRAVETGPGARSMLRHVDFCGPPTFHVRLQRTYRRWRNLHLSLVERRRRHT